MFHLCAYTEVIGNVADTDVDALQDDILLIQNTHFVPAQDLDLVGAWAGSATLSRVRVNCASIRQYAPPFIRPIEQSVTPLAWPAVCDLRQMPVRIPRNEELKVEATSAVAMTERFTAILALRREFRPAPVGTPFNQRGTSTTAAVANAWTSVATTWVDTPKAGLYGVVGLEVQSTNAIAARLIFEDQPFRPGSVSVTVLGRRQHPMFFDGGLGLWGVFNAYRYPTVQVLCNGADAAHEIYMQVVPLGMAA